MTRLSKNGIKTLKKQYLSVLLKCMAINAGLFMLAAPAMAHVQFDVSGTITDIVDQSGLILGSGNGGAFYIVSDGVNITLDNTSDTPATFTNNRVTSGSGGAIYKSGNNTITFNDGATFNG